MFSTMLERSKKTFNSDRNAKRYLLLCKGLAITFGCDIVDPTGRGSFV